MLHHEVDCADVDLSILIFKRGRCIDYHLRGVEPGKKGLLLTQKDSPYLYPQKITNKKLTFLVPQIFRAQPQRNRPQDCNGLKYFQIIYPMFPKRDKIEMFPTI